MVRHFCDNCSVGITEANACVGGHTNPKRLGTTLAVLINGDTHQFRAELLTSLDGVADAGDFCKYCVLDAFLRLDDRAMPAVPRLMSELSNLNNLLAECVTALSGRPELQARVETMRHLLKEGAQ